MSIVLIGECNFLRDSFTFLHAKLPPVAKIKEKKTQKKTPRQGKTKAICASFPLHMAAGHSMPLL